MQVSDYHKKIEEYYNSTENAYKDSWDLDHSLAIHFGYWDSKVRTFRQSLLRMNEIMMEVARIGPGDLVLDAGCGVGGSSIFIASRIGCRVTGITLSERQVAQAKKNAERKGLDDRVEFRKMDFGATGFEDASFDVVWGCESICYADDKEQFIREAYRILKPGGRLVIADGFVTNFGNNDHPVIRKWLDGWQVNYLESPTRFLQFMKDNGYAHTQYRDINRYTSNSSRRLLRFYYLANLYLAWKKITFSDRSTSMQRKNIQACKYQYQGQEMGLWQYGLITGQKP
jgi:tocopherol O-methyltransferase